MSLGNSTSPVLAGAVALVLGLAGCIGASAPSAKILESIRTGDTAQFQLRIFDEVGVLLFSSASEDEETMVGIQADFEGLYKIPETFADFHHVVGDNESSPPFRNSTVSLPLNPALIGHKIGDKLRIPLNGILTPTEISLERLRDPLPRTVTISLSEFTNLSKPLGGGLFRIAGILNARLVELSSESATVQFEFDAGSDEKLLPINQTTLKAEILPDSASETFRILLHASVGDRFVLQKSCILPTYKLPSGSYEVNSVTDSTISLGRASSLYPQLVERPLIWELTITDIRGPSDQEVIENNEPL